MALVTFASSLCPSTRRALAVGVCLLSLQPSLTQAEPVNYAFDPAHTRVHWEVTHFGTSTSRGRFDDITGSLVLDTARGTGEVSVTVRTASVNTGVAPLDGVVRRSYLASEANPLAYFVATGWRFSPESSLDIRGELTLRGVSRPLTLRAERLHCHQHPQLQREVCGADLQGELIRSDHGITDGLPFIGDRVRLVIQVEAIRQDR